MCGGKNVTNNKDFYTDNTQSRLFISIIHATRIEVVILENFW